LQKKNVKANLSGVQNKKRGGGKKTDVSEERRVEEKGPRPRKDKRGRTGGKKKKDTDLREKNQKKGG